MPPQRYHRTTDQDRESLVESQENGEDFITLAHNLDIITGNGLGQKQFVSHCFKSVREFFAVGRLAVGQFVVRKKFSFG